MGLTAEGRVPRRFPRIVWENPLLVREERSRSDHEFRRTRVIGLGGLMFLSDRLYGTGDLLGVALPLGDTVVETRCRVVYENPCEAGVEVGLEFLSLTPEERRALEAVVARGDASSVTDSAVGRLRACRGAAGKS